MCVVLITVSRQVCISAVQTHTQPAGHSEINHGPTCQRVLLNSNDTVGTVEERRKEELFGLDGAALAESPQVH